MPVQALLALLLLKTPAPLTAPPPPPLPAHWTRSTPTTPAVRSASPPALVAPPPLLPAASIRNTQIPVERERVIVAQPVPDHAVAPMPSGKNVPGENPRAGSASLSATVAVTPEPAEEERVPLFGLQIHGGIPDGLGASLVVRPWKALRLNVGGLTNTKSAGLVGGITLAPFFFPLAPTLTAEAGQLGNADLTEPVRWLSSQAIPDGSVTGAYRFVSAQVGLELGSPRRFVFYVRAGFSYLEATLQGTPQVFGSSSSRLESGEVTLHGHIPSAKLGFTLYL